MRILMMSWKCIKHPWKGGAEFVTYEYLKRLVEKGHECVWFVPKFKGCLEREIIDGIEIVRDFNIYTIHINAWRKYYSEFKGKFDVIIDQINGIPFFTPLYAKEPIIFFIHHYEDICWDYEMPFPLNKIGKFVERNFLRLYKNIPTICVSPSTKKDLITLGFKEENIYVIYNGCDVKPLEKINFEEKEENAICFVSRLTPMKRVEHAIKAVYYVKKEIPNVKLWILGSPKKESYLYKLKILVDKLGLKNNVKFFGYVPFEKRNEIIKKSQILIVTSVKEGWGLNVIEANALGTPVVGYRVSGLVDSIKDGYNGLLVDDGDIMKLSETIINLLKDDDLRMKLSRNAVEWAKQFSWDKSAEEFKRILEMVVNNG
ncbi:glycosyltransferase family 4 protein [Methanocaldococcus sp.]|uniref:glycosyltransferase family 4 protein n=1 Tax=Methanocaldococcus sp. TaxID=2152917 RepID=UPI00261A6A62|nr:glycosyltransferase family 4 protein [Methanocaldococcus sp.]MCQ6254493.1 glycosyltransferase family 4 protein [Methanocaldococcus sp.]